MKAKDWIKELEKLDSNKEVYLKYSTNGDDWGYCISEVRFEQRDLEEVTFGKNRLVYDNDGNGKALGLCNTIRIY